MLNQYSPKRIKLEATKRGRGRLPGELKGTKYNVPPKRQITVNLSEEHFELLEKLSKELKISRSKIANMIIEEFCKFRGYK